MSRCGMNGVHTIPTRFGFVWPGFGFGPACCSHITTTRGSGIKRRRMRPICWRPNVHTSAVGAERIYGRFQGFSVLPLPASQDPTPQNQKTQEEVVCAIFPIFPICTTFIPPHNNPTDKITQIPKGSSSAMKMFFRVMWGGVKWRRRNFPSP